MITTLDRAYLLNYINNTAARAIKVQGDYRRKSVLSCIDMDRVRTSTIFFFMLLLAWSKVAQGCGGGGGKPKIEYRYIPGPPGPPGETKTVYVNVPATIPPEVSQHIKKSKCFQENIVQCEPYRVT